MANFQFPNFPVPFPFQNMPQQLQASMQPVQSGQYGRFGASETRLPTLPPQAQATLPQLPSMPMPQLPPSQMPQLPPGMPPPNMNMPSGANSFQMPGTSQVAQNFNNILRDLGPRVAYSYLGNNYNGGVRDALLGQFGAEGLHGINNNFGATSGGGGYISLKNDRNGFSYVDPTTHQRVTYRFPT